MTQEVKSKTKHIPLFKTPESLNEVLDFCAHASTPADATMAAMMVWNYCCEHYSDPEAKI